MQDRDRFEDLPILGELRERLRSQFESRSSPRSIVLRRWLHGHLRLVTVLLGVALATGSATAAVVRLFEGEPPFSPGAVILARGHGPDGSNYELAVAASKCPGWVHVELRSSTGYSYGGCGEPLRATLIPRVISSGSGGNWESVEGTVSSRAHNVRVLLAAGGSITAPVYRIPRDIAKDAGLFYFFANHSIEHALKFQSLDGHGRVLASGPPPPDGFSHPVMSLTPGIVTVARGRTPHGTRFEIELQRIRFLGKKDLCVSEKPQGNMQCPPYPVRGTAPVFLLQGGEGSCFPPRYQLLAGLLLRRGLTAWIQTPGRSEKLKTASVPAVFRVSGGVFYGVLTRAPAKLVVRNRRGARVYSTSVSGELPAGACGGLDPSTSDGS
jgi:hypothetical protein